VTLLGQEIDLGDLGRGEAGDFLGSHTMELTSMTEPGEIDDERPDMTDMAAEKLEISLDYTNDDGEDDSLSVKACAWIAQVDKDSFDVEIESNS
jgi:hypothetical protein